MPSSSFFGVAFHRHRTLLVPWLRAKGLERLRHIAFRFTKSFFYLVKYTYLEAILDEHDGILLPRSRC